MDCEETEDRETCREDCTPAFDYVITSISRAETKIESIGFTVTNNQNFVITKMACDYYLYNSEGELAKKGVFHLASDTTLGELGPLDPGETESYVIAPYEEMYSDPPYTIEFACNGETKSFTLR